jgi:hypothetical protein
VIIMPKANVVMYGEPVQHGLVYGSCLFKKIAEDAKAAAKIQVVETNGTASADDDALATYDPAVFYQVGHGQCCIFSAECRTPYIEATGYHCHIHFACDYYDYDCKTSMRLDSFAGRHIHLQSCVTGLNLGPELIKHGARSYIGYKNLFVYGVYVRGGSTGPCEPPTPLADLFSFGDSDAEGERAIALKGSTVGEAVAAIKSKFEEYIKKYTEGEWKDRPVAPYAAMYLQHDLDNLVALGDMAWRPCPAAAPPIPPVVMPGMSFLMALPILFGGIIFGRQTEKSEKK